MDDEFLITNQLGSYSSSTFHHGNTRKYHGLLIVSNEELQRKVVVGTLEEKIKVAEHTYFFNTANFYPNTISPNGAQYLVKFSINKLAVSFEYAFPKVIVHKEIYLAQEANAVIVRYNIVSKEHCKLILAPLLTNRSIHKLQQYKKNDEFPSKKFLNSIVFSFNNTEKISLKILSFNPKNLLNLHYNIELDPVVYQNFEYPLEISRGYDYIEDMIRSAEISFEIEPGDNFISLQFSYENSDEMLPSRINNSLKLIYNLDKAKEKKEEPPLIEFKNFLTDHHHDFLIDNNHAKTIVAGYPWFNDWGRDTFISFKGLLLCTWETRYAFTILTYWAAHIKNGLLPNSLSDKTYNSIDGSLWFIIAVYYYYEASKDLPVLPLLLPKIKAIISKLIAGTEFTIHVDKNGYLVWTDPSYSLTWMDSHLNSASSTQRIGAAVEVQMLWYNALKCYQTLCDIAKSPDYTDELDLLIKKLYRNFSKDFWNANDEYLYDYLYDSDKNPSIRPNAIIGLSLPYKILTKTKALQVLDTAKEKLVTPLGLMTLSKDNPLFKERYYGNQEQRDLAYHNGTIWPFLLGFYLKAHLNYSRNDADVIRMVKRSLENFWVQITEKNLHYLPELFSPDDLHPDGALAQAWNYGVFLEVITEIVN